MKRIDVFLSQALEEDFRQHWEDACIKLRIKCKYSKIDNVTGQGESDPRLGNSVWPQFNTEYIVFCEENGFFKAKYNNSTIIVEKRNDYIEENESYSLC